MSSLSCSIKSCFDLSVIGEAKVSPKTFRHPRVTPVSNQMSSPPPKPPLPRGSPHLHLSSRVTLSSNRMPPPPLLLPRPSWFVTLSSLIFQGHPILKSNDQPLLLIRGGSTYLHLSSRISLSSNRMIPLPPPPLLRASKCQVEAESNHVHVHIYIAKSKQKLEKKKKNLPRGHSFPFLKSLS